MNKTSATDWLSARAAALCRLSEGAEPRLDSHAQPLPLIAIY